MENKPLATPDIKTRKVKCPHCGQDAIYATTNPWRPFCSERCHKIDLGAWASESYRIEAQNSDQAETPDQAQ